MNIKHATATIAAALVLAGSPAIASTADAQSGPIHIDAVRTYGGGYTDGNGNYNYVPGSIVIQFKNEASSPAIGVTFAVETNGFVIRRLDDVGTFTHGIAIAHTFPEAPAIGDEYVSVAQARFADGSTWSNPEVPAALQPAASAGVRATSGY